MQTLLQENEDFFQRKDLDLYFLPRIELEEGQMFKVPINQMMEAIFLPHLEDKLPFNFFFQNIKISFQLLIILMLFMYVYLWMWAFKKEDSWNDLALDILWTHKRQ